MSTFLFSHSLPPNAGLTIKAPKLVFEANLGFAVISSSDEGAKQVFQEATALGFRWINVLPLIAPPRILI